MFNRFGMAFRESIKGIFRSGLMSILTVLIVSVALFVFGSFIMLVMNLKNISVSLNDKLDVMIYLQPQANVEMLEKIKNKIISIQGVKKIQFITKEEAWEKFKVNYAGMELEKIVEENPLPDAFRISVEDLDYIDVVVSKIESEEGIDEIRYGKDAAQKMKQLIILINLVGLVLIAILFFATLMIVVNTIGLTIIARQNEIDIMLLVGATRSFISLPFIFEGLIIGVIGGFIAVIAMITTYSAVILNIREKLSFIPLALTETDLMTAYFMVVFLGLILGAIGSSLSVNRAIKLE